MNLYYLAAPDQSGYNNNQGQIPQALAADRM